MKRQHFILLVSALVCLSVLTGCGTYVVPSAPAPTIKATQTPRPTQTPKATDAAAPTPTEAPKPTDAPKPTSTPKPSATPAATADYIGEAEAQRLALEHAGFAEGDVTYLHVHLDLDDLKPEYDVEFHKGAIEYDYEIDAVSGAIVSFDADMD